LASASFSLAVSLYGGFSVSLAEPAVALQWASPPLFFDRLTIGSIPVSISARGKPSDGPPLLADLAPIAAVLERVAVYKGDQPLLIDHCAAFVDVADDRTKLVHGPHGSNLRWRR
jgi:hypothetical protein